MRLNRSPPNISFRKKKTGGIAVNSMLQLTNLDERTIQRILQARAPRPARPPACAAAALPAAAGRRWGAAWRLSRPCQRTCLALVATVPPPAAAQEYKIHNCDLLFKEDSTVDDLIDVIEGNRRYVKCLYVYNKIDVCSMEEVDEIARRPFSIPISCYQKLNFDGLLARIWDMMVRRRGGGAAVGRGHGCARVCAARRRGTPHPGRPCRPRPAQGLVRVYTKKVGNKPDFGEPVVLR